jgi:hypothetical protein
MVRRFSLFCMVLPGLALAKDPTQPVTRGSLELSSGIGIARFTGKFDSTGGYHSYPDSTDPALFGVPLGIRAGLGNGFDVRASWSYLRTNADAGSKTGMSQPSLSIRKVGKNLGAFTTLTLPFAPGDFDNGDLHTALEIGGIFRLKGDHYRLTSLASYIDDFDENEIIRFYGRPEIIWTKGVGTFITWDFLKAWDEDAWLLSLGPGTRIDFTDAFALEATTPFSVAGRNSPIAGWAASIRGIWTMKY